MSSFPRTKALVWRFISFPNAAVANKWFDVRLPEGRAHVKFDQIDLDLMDKDKLEEMRKTATPVIKYKTPPMEVNIGEEGQVILSKVYEGITLETNDKETMSICMRDSGFEFTYEGIKYSAQKGVISMNNKT